jgi:hypothetical protein
MGRRGALLTGLAVAAACIALTLFFPVVRFRLRSLGRLHEFAHVPLFALVTAGLAPAFPGTMAPGAWVRGRAVLRAVLVSILLGGLVELLQPRFGGATELGDLARDAIGAVACGLVLFSLPATMPRWPGRGLRLLAVAQSVDQ